jgi:methyltransferase-like protein
LQSRFEAKTQKHSHRIGFSKHSTINLKNKTKIVLRYFSQLSFPPLNKTNLKKLPIKTQSKQKHILVEQIRQSKTVERDWSPGIQI